MLRNSTRKVQLCPSVRRGRFESWLSGALWSLGAVCSFKINSNCWCVTSCLQGTAVPGVFVKWEWDGLHFILTWCLDAVNKLLNYCRIPVQRVLLVQNKGDVQVLHIFLCSAETMALQAKGFWMLSLAACFEHYEGSVLCFHFLSLFNIFKNLLPHFPNRPQQI